MSHEIRTPLNAIIGFSDLLKDKNIDKNVQSKYSEYISFAARSLLDLINYVLDLSKLESGNFETTKELCDFGTLCASIIALFEKKFQQKNLASISKIDNIPPVYIDKRRIKQILFNLLGNALKFTKKGSIELGASFKKTAAKKGTLTFYIKDTGIGIRKEDAKNLFKPFVQVKSFRGHCRKQRHRSRTRNLPPNAGKNGRFNRFEKRIRRRFGFYHKNKRHRIRRQFAGHEQKRD